MKDVVVIGLGNPLMSDEGVGIAVLQALRERGEHPRADFIDAGTSGMKALHAMAGRKKVVFVDCARMKAQPGTLKRFGPDAVASRKELPGFSLHEGDLLGAIGLSRRIGECRRGDLGIEPARLELGRGCQPNCARLGRYVAAVGRVAACRAGRTSCMSYHMPEPGGRGAQTGRAAAPAGWWRPVLVVGHYQVVPEYDLRVRDLTRDTAAQVPAGCRRVPVTARCRACA